MTIECQCPTCGQLHRSLDVGTPSGVSWTCGHTAKAMCAECYHELARKAHELQEEVDRLREELRREDRLR